MHCLLMQLQVQGQGCCRNIDELLAYQKNLKQIQNVNVPSSSTFQDGVITERKLTYTGKEILSYGG